MDFSHCHFITQQREKFGVVNNEREDKLRQNVRSSKPKRERLDFIPTFVKIYWIEAFSYSVSLFFFKLIYIFIIVLFSSFSFALFCFSTAIQWLLPRRLRRPSKSTSFFHCSAKTKWVEFKIDWKHKTVR